MAFTEIQQSADQSPHQHKRVRTRRRRQRTHRRELRASSPSTSSDNGSVSEGSSTTSTSLPNKKKANNSRCPRQVRVEVQPKDESLFVALDCEMVGVGLDGKQSALARVTIINWHGDVLMDEYIHQEREVADYRTFVSGITKDLLDNATLDMTACRQQVMGLLDGKILVGHGLKNDMRVLGITHPWYMTRDTAKYEPFMKVRFDDGVLWPRGLKDLCQEKLSRDVQVVGRPHCPYEDAMAALDLYKLAWKQWEKTMEYKINKTKSIEQRQQGWPRLAKE
ncbi:Interferon-stimulated 20 kDa exonuclease-like 2 [Seminavis robusta]|uniref:RNA exonuclease 4 n=1 Tax=Seminavis robusta TaxID=568900 RepID=A0A9N8EAF8_9STRA|nr:Interferon-stimulated 20 kDa exonuclease-like 2 [Seminavis robusta]|eukprot:Sro882_g215310.1 Interferon-stimulated 20 kDa exonuclease-like 2 (279) ;mRNA; f:5157-6077